MRFKRKTIPGRFKRKDKRTMKITPGREGWSDKTRDLIERMVENINGGYGEGLKTVTAIINKNYPNGKRRGRHEHPGTITEALNRNCSAGKKRVKRMGRG